MMSSVGWGGGAVGIVGKNACSTSMNTLVDPQNLCWKSQAL